jgi:hypothetical protein
MMRVDAARDRLGAPDAAPVPDAPAPKCHVLGDGATDFSGETVERLLARGEFFWLDLYRPDAADFEILRDDFKFHPLAVEDSEHFNQRAKVDEYEDFVFIVAYGASSDRDRLVEVHCFYSGPLPGNCAPRRLSCLRRTARALRPTKRTDSGFSGLLWSSGALHSQRRSARGGWL